MASTSHGFSLMINLSNYVENGIYRIMTNVTWLRFLHCNNGVGSSNVTDQTYDVNPMNLSITGLVPNSEYNMSVVVSNAAGSRTQRVSDETWEAGIYSPYIVRNKHSHMLNYSAAPQDIVAVNQTLFTITICWQPVDCAHMNGNIRGYKVKYWERGSGNETKLDGNTTGTSYTLTDQQSSTTYVIQVAAENDAGVGVFGNLNASTLLCKFNFLSVSTFA